MKMRGPDPKDVRRAFRKAAARYASADFLHAEIRTRLLERLEPVLLDPGTVLDLGAGPPQATGDLARRYPQARLLAIEAVPEMLGAGAERWLPVCADAARLPLPAACADLAVANMLLHWCEDPQAVLSEARRVLRYPGLFGFSTLGPDSLRELRSAWAKVDSYGHVHDFADMHNIGDALIRAGFAEPVLDTERITITYRDIDRLATDLRAVGAGNVAERRARGLTTPARWAAMTRAYEGSRNAEGLFPVTIEVIYALAWTGETPVSFRDEAGGIVIPLGSLQRRG
jgi:malonyl-CoA O-methyltransferase